MQTYKYSINPYWSKFESCLLDIKNTFAQSSDSLHKARNEIRLIDFDEAELVVKSFKVPGKIRSFIYSYLRQSKARRSFDYSLILANFAPVPVGYIEFYQAGLLQESFYVSEKFDYDFTIREPLSNQDFPERDKIFTAFANFSFELHENNILHQDYSPGNILIKKNNDGYEFKVVDVNRMQFRQLGVSERARNLCKLWASDEALKTIATNYAAAMGCDVNDFVKQALLFSHKHKAGRTRKARIKKALGL